MYGAAHACAAKVRRLFQTERHQLHAQCRRLFPEQTPELDQSSHTAGVVIGSRQRPGGIVVRADNDAFGGLWSKPRDYVAIRSTLDLVRLLGNSCACLREFAGDVRRHSIQIFYMTFVAGRKLTREFADVSFESSGIDGAGWIRLRAREQRLS